MDGDKFEHINIEFYRNSILTSQEEAADLKKHLKNEIQTSENECKKVCPRGSWPGTIYESGKLHKLPFNNCNTFCTILSPIWNSHVEIS